MNKEERKNYYSTLLYVLSLLLILGPTLYFGVKGKVAEMGVALAAGTLAAAFLQLDKLQRFKGAGIEIELKKAVEEAQATLENLKEFTDPVYISTIKIMSEGHTWNGVPKNTQHDIVKKIEMIVRKNGASEDVSRTIKEFYNFNLNQLYIDIINEVDRYYKPGVTEKLKLLSDAENAIYPSEKQVRAVISELPNKGSKLEEKIIDYVYYRENLYPRSRS